MASVTELIAQIKKDLCLIFAVADASKAMTWIIPRLSDFGHSIGTLKSLKIA